MSDPLTRKQLVAARRKAGLDMSEAAARGDDKAERDARTRFMLCDVRLARLEGGEENEAENEAQNEREPDSGNHTS